MTLMGTGCLYRKNIRFDVKMSIFLLASNNPPQKIPPLGIPVHCLLDVGISWDVSICRE